MLKLLFDLSCLGFWTSTIYFFMVVAGVLRFAYFRSRVRPNLAFLPPVSLLKPLHGAEPGLEAHLESFLLQDYPNYEILFCARHPRDAGLQAARRVAARYPEIPVRFLTVGEPPHTNAKISSLERMAAVAKHDIFVISDSDVRVQPEYLREVVAPFADRKVGLVTCLYRGVAAEGGAWAQLEGAGMSVEMTSGVLVADMLEGTQFALGPTMAVRRKCVREIGGFGSIGEYCADDFVLGNRVAANGHTVVLSNHVIDHIVLNRDLPSSIRHQVRWMKSTRFSRPRGHLGTVFTFGVPFGVIAALAALGLGQPQAALSLLGWSVALRVLQAALVGGVVVGERGRTLTRTAMLYPLRDLLGFVYWLASYVDSNVFWRGELYKLTAGGRMRPAHGMSAESEPALTA